MAKIGSPLPLDQRKGVQERIPLGGSGQISTNVPAQRLQMMDYSIGQANAKASQLVGNELMGMAVKVGDAVVYKMKIDKQRAQLKMESEVHTTQRAYEQEFAAARTADEQDAIIGRYDKELVGFGQRFDKEGWGSVQDAALKEQLLSQSKGILAEFRIKNTKTKYTDTVSRLELKLARGLKDGASKLNIDAKRTLDDGIRTIEQMRQIGHLTDAAMFEKVQD